MKSEQPKQFYICTGFHRSGTSFVAKTLDDNGISMGADLMGASFANQAGHFEDIPFVELHEQLLQLNGSDWRYLGEPHLSIPPSFLGKMRDYIERRREVNDSELPIGAKDPRALLFLPHWQEVLQENLVSILVFRDWRYAVSSILKRHSRELLQFNTPMQQRSIDLDFWRYPHMAAHMWLSAARLMIDWKVKHPDSTLLMEQSVVIEQSDKLIQIAAGKGIHQRAFAATSYDHTLMQSEIPQSMLDMIPDCVQQACFDTMQALQTEADITNTQTINSSPPVRLAIRLSAELQNEEKLADVPNAKQFLNLSSIPWDDAIEVLQVSPNPQKIDVDWQSLLNREQLNSSHYDQLYACAIRFGRLDIAELALHRAIDINPQAWRHLHLGDVYMRLKMFNKAKQRFQIAQTLAPESPNPLARLSEIETHYGRFQEAQDLIDEASKIDDSKPSITQAKNRLVGMQKQLANAQRGKEITGAMKISNFQTVLDLMAEDPAKGKRLDKYHVDSIFVIRDNRSWIANGCCELNKTSQLCLLDYICRHIQQRFIVGHVGCSSSVCKPFIG